MRRISLLLLLAFCANLPAQTAGPLAPPAPAKPLTVEQIYPQEQATRPPDGLAWSPDGTRMSYIRDGAQMLQELVSVRWNAVRGRYGKDIEPTHRASLEKR